MAASTPETRVPQPRAPPTLYSGANSLSRTPPEQRSLMGPGGAGTAVPRAPSNRGGHGGRSRLSGDQRHLAVVGEMGTPTSAGGLNGQSRPMAAPHMGMHQSGGQSGRFEGPRSPPGNKNTSHVPCKFFSQGACQAGKACPFSHSRDAATRQAPCKYFAKGNCKYGQACLLAHVLPDGRRVNRPSMPSGGPGGGMRSGSGGGGPGAANGGQLFIGGRVNPENYANQGSALATSLLQANTGPLQYQQPDEYPSPPNPSLRNIENLPSIDTGYGSSHPGSKYGSPPDDTRFPVSPAIKGLSALDAPLPASFDSNGISWIARNGPVAASVPSQFGLESPQHSYVERNTSEALRNLHDSAFGETSRPRPGQATSPPTNTGDYLNHRSQHLRPIAKPQPISSSLPRAGLSGDWDELAYEEDFIPHSLHELLTPQEKQRRLSRNTAEEDGSRPSFSGPGTPGDSGSKVGSPTNSGSSRYGALFSRQRREEESGAGANATSAFGHVGSPLRNSSLDPGSPSLNAVRRPTSGDVSPYFASPPRQSSMSMISQQLQRARLSSRAEPASSSGPTNPAPSSAPIGTSSRTDRTVSSSSVGTTRFAPSIDEEQSEVFSMDEDRDSKRNSGSATSATGDIPGAATSKSNPWGYVPPVESNPGHAHGQATSSNRSSSNFGSIGDKR